MIKLLFSLKIKKNAELITDNADIIFLLDFNSLSRLSDYEDVVERSSAVKIMIDHHQDVDRNAANIIISDTKSCSTSQLLFEVIEKLEYKYLINQDITECLYAGIMTDTGSFRYSTTTSKTHNVIAELINFGAIYSKVHDLGCSTGTFINKLKTRHLSKNISINGYDIEKKMVNFAKKKNSKFKKVKIELKDIFYFQKIEI